MTSKEALRKLMLDDFTPMNDLVYRKNLNNEIQIAKPMYLGVSPEDCYNIIEKDLTILEKLKSHIVEIDNDKDNGDDYYFIVLLKTKEVRELLEELIKELI